MDVSCGATQPKRVDIFRIHLGLKSRDRKEFDLEALAEVTEGYTGADIKHVVQLGLKLAFHACKNLANEHLLLLQAVPEIRPLSQTDAERVALMTQWLDRHARAASVRKGKGSRPGAFGVTLGPPDRRSSRYGP